MLRIAREPCLMQKCPIKRLAWVLVLARQPNEGRQSDLCFIVYSMIVLLCSLKTGEWSDSCALANVVIVSLRLEKLSSIEDRGQTDRVDLQSQAWCCRDRYTCSRLRRAHWCCAVGKRGWGGRPRLSGRPWYGHWQCHAISLPIHARN